MKKIFNILLASVVLCLVLVGFVQEASAQTKHVYLQFNSIGCPNTSGSGYLNYALSWKSAVPLPEQENNFVQFWPEESDPDNAGFCGPGAPDSRKVIEINRNFKFPVDLDRIGQVTVGGGGTPVGEFDIPATENYEYSGPVGSGGYAATVDFSVKFLAE